MKIIYETLLESNIIKSALKELINHELYIPFGGAIRLFSSYEPTNKILIRKLTVARNKDLFGLEPVGWTINLHKFGYNFLWSYVKEDFRRQGIGTELVKLAMDESRERFIVEMNCKYQRNFWQKTLKERAIAA